MFALIAVAVLLVVALVLSIPEIRSAVRVMKCQKRVNKAVKSGTLRRL